MISQESLENNKHITRALIGRKQYFYLLVYLFFQNQIELDNWTDCKVWPDHRIYVAKENKKHAFTQFALTNFEVVT